LPTGDSGSSKAKTDKTAIYEWREFAKGGGLMSYGSDIVDACHRLGVYTGMVLAGANPAELPIDQAVRIELVLNLKDREESTEKGSEEERSRCI
jgi:ABC-type uncharacterized transport system substrate-binding protein